MKKSHIIQPPAQPPLSPADMQRIKMEEDRRLEMLREQKESDRKEKEGALWREASKMSTLSEKKVQTATMPPATPQAAKPISGFFAKLRLGKFLE